MDASILADARAFVSAHYKFPDRFPLLARIRETGRIVPVDDIRLVTRYDHLVEGYRDQRLSRQAGAIAESQAHSSGSTAPNIEKARKAFTLMLINQDDPGHARIRKILETAFKPTRVASWATVMQQITDELLANVAGRESFDFRKELAFPLPERIICALMGVPYEDHDLWAAWTEEVVSSARSTEPTPERLRPSTRPRSISTTTTRISWPNDARISAKISSRCSSGPKAKAKGSANLN